MKRRDVMKRSGVVKRSGVMNRRGQGRGSLPAVVTAAVLWAVAVGCTGTPDDAGTSVTSGSSSGSTTSSSDGPATDGSSVPASTAPVTSSPATTDAGTTAADPSIGSSDAGSSDAGSNGAGSSGAGTDGAGSDGAGPAGTDAGDPADATGFVPGDINQTVPAVPETTLPAAPLDATATAAPAVTARLGEITAVTAQAIGPGEVSGPAYRVEVELTSTATAPVSLDGVTIAAFDQAGTPLVSMTGPPAEPFAGDLAPGTSAKAVLVFAHTAEQSAEISVTVSVRAGEPVALFSGTVPS